MQRFKYKLVCTKDWSMGNATFNTGQIITTSDEPIRFGGEWGWVQDAGCAEWQENLPTPEEIQLETKANLIAAVKKHLDACAQAKGYDDIKSACTYADEPAVPKFQTEGQGFRKWRSLVWEQCYQVIDDALAGKRPVPTPEELVAELPTLKL